MIKTVSQKELGIKIGNRKKIGLDYKRNRSPEFTMSNAMLQALF